MDKEYLNNRDRFLETESAVLLVARPQEGRGSQDLMSRICAYVEEHLTEKLTLRDVAKIFQVSVSTVTQLFQRKSDMTFHQYLTRQRMQLAKQLIQDRVPLEEVGKLVGYVDHSTFYRAFRQTFGISPREYRKKLNL